MERSSALWLLLGALALGAVTPKPRKKQRLTRAELVALARSVGFDDPDYAATIALRESGGNVNAVNFNPPIETSYGLWQINTLAWKKYSKAELLTTDGNARAAFEIHRQAGWAPWSTAKEKRK